MNINSVLQGDPDTLLVVRRGDLLDYSDTLVQKIKTELSAPQRDNDTPIPQPEAIKMLKKSRQTFVNWRKKGLITAYAISGKLYYKPSELTAAMKKAEI